MRFSLSNDHYAAAWPLEENYKLEDITQLGVRYASLEEGPEKQNVLLSIVRCFHAYLMKYTEMVQRGHIPIYKNRMNPDSANFLRRFVRRGDQPNRENLRAACKTLHLAFEQLSADETYNILASILIRVINAYDPEYTGKIRLVAEAIDRRAAVDEVITGDELGLAFDPQRFLRWLARKGNLELVRDPRKGKIIGFRKAAWPPSASVLGAAPIGLAYHVQKWFGSCLQTYITTQMKTVEVRGEMLPLSHRKAHAGPRIGEEVHGDQGLPCASGEGILNPRSGRSYRSDVALWQGQFDISKLDLRWVDETRDPLFADLSPYERRILYLRFAGGRTWKIIAKLCRKGIKTVQGDYCAILDKIRNKGEIAPVFPDLDLEAAAGRRSGQGS
jgi:hypothetical protein